jgi:hypothetical protein
LADVCNHLYRLESNGLLKKFTGSDGGEQANASAQSVLTPEILMTASFGGWMDLGPQVYYVERLTNDGASKVNRHVLNVQYVCSVNTHCTLVCKRC